MMIFIEVLGCLKCVWSSAPKTQVRIMHNNASSINIFSNLKHEIQTYLTGLETGGSQASGAATLSAGAVSPVAAAVAPSGGALVLPSVRVGSAVAADAAAVAVAERPTSRGASRLKRDGSCGRGLGRPAVAAAAGAGPVPAAGEGAEEEGAETAEEAAGMAAAEEAGVGAGGGAGSDTGAGAATQAAAVGAVAVAAVAGAAGAGAAVGAAGAGAAAVAEAGAGERTGAAGAGAGAETGAGAAVEAGAGSAGPGSVLAGLGRATTLGCSRRRGRRNAI